MARLRLGLIGAGRWGRAYIRTVSAMPGVALTAVASANPETRSLVPAGCVVTSDWRAMIGMPDVDAVIVATPPLSHFEMAAAALDAGKPVLVEKPLACGLREAEALADRARMRGLALMVDHTHLFAPAFRELVRRIPTLGGVAELRGRAGNEGPFRADAPVLWDWGAHDVAMGIAIAGRPLGQAMRRLDRRPGIANAEAIALTLRWTGGLAADIELSNIAPAKHRHFEALGPQGSLIYDDLAAVKLTFVPRDGPPQPIPVSAEAPLTAAVAAFAAMAGGPPDQAALVLACDTVRVLEACEPWPADAG